MSTTESLRADIEAFELSPWVGVPHDDEYLDLLVDLVPTPPPVVVVVGRMVRLPNGRYVGRKRVLCVCGVGGEKRVCGG